MDKKWVQENFFDLAFFCIIAVVLVWSMVTSNGSIVDKILLVALGMFKGVPLVNNKKE